jgi:ribulose 1,5-bisphosphate synthetase/thiazole synthase
MYAQQILGFNPGSSQQFKFTRHHRCRATRHRQATRSDSRVETDVAIVGAGIIGLITAATLLETDSEISVTLIDRSLPGASTTGAATGAGQG